MAQDLGGVPAWNLLYPFQESKGDREMKKLHLSLSYDYPEAIQRAIQLFTEETGIQVDVEVLEHQERSLLTNFAIHQTGPDISEVGSTWLSNLVSMAAIRPFSGSDVLKVGGQTAFVKGNWEYEYGHGLDAHPRHRSLDMECWWASDFQGWTSNDVQ
jgi:hypothetical protein